MIESKLTYGTLVSFISYLIKKSGGGAGILGPMSRGAGE